MARTFRARRAIKWTWVVLSLLTISAWATNLWWQFVLTSPVLLVLTFDDAIVVREPDSEVHLLPFEVGFFKQKYIGPIFDPPTAFFDKSSKSPIPTQVTIPFWLLFLLTAIPAAWMCHRDRRMLSCSFDHLLCIRCGYNLTSNTSGVCPECGEKATMANIK